MRKYLTAVLSVLGLGFAIYWVVISAQKPPVAPPFHEPAQNPYEATIAGAGIIEAAGRNISLAPPMSGQVAEIYVKENDIVKRGAKLYRLDDREQRAALDRAEANIARAQTAVLTAQADISTQEAVAKSAQANIEELKALLADAEEIRASNEEIYKSGVLAYRVYQSSLKARDAAKARVEAAEAQFAQAEAQKRSAIARLEEAQANLKVLQAEQQELLVTFNRLTVVAPTDGSVLQLNIRVGEYVSSTPPLAPILFGETDSLQVRVDVDEVNASRVTPGSRAIAHLKGDANKTVPLEFVRIDPYILPKKSLTGDNTERVDVRVLQVIYRFQPPKFPIYVGQQVDVFIDAMQPTTAEVRR
ncbi:MAG: biotin/lipoyl-binding protein [Acidobacteriota bacterium]